MEGPGTPGSKKTGAERTREYREKNEQAAKLSVLKFQVKTAQKRGADSDFDLEYKAKQAERKRRYRAAKSIERRASEKVASESGSDEDPGPRKVLVEKAPKSRQAMVGLLQRKRTNIDKNDAIGSLVVEKQCLSKQIEEQKQLIAEFTVENKILSDEVC